MQYLEKESSIVSLIMYLVCAVVVIDVLELIEMQWNMKYGWLISKKDYKNNFNPDNFKLILKKWIITVAVLVVTKLKCWNIL